MEITFYLQFQHPPCSTQEPDWDLLCLSWVTLWREQNDASTLCHKQVCVGVAGMLWGFGKQAQLPYPLWTAEICNSEHCAHG